MNRIQVRTRNPSETSWGSGQYLIILAGLFGVTLRASLTDASLAGALAAMTVLLLSAWLLRGTRRVGLLSLGGLVALFSLGAFWAKWLLGTGVSGMRNPPPSDNDAAITLYAVFLAFFCVAWFSAGPKRLRPELEILPLRVSRLFSSPASIVFLLLACLLLLGLRLFLAERYLVGVPGSIPLIHDNGFRIFGALYYLSTYGPLMVAALILLSPSARVLRLSSGLATLIGYALIGAALGYRGYGVSAAVVAMYCINYNGDESASKQDRGKRRGRVFVLAIVVGLVTLFTVGQALDTRPIATTTGGPFSSLEFVTNRIGGLDYLSPAVYRVHETGPDWANISPNSWNRYLKVEVYRFPEDMTNGLAGTLVGWLYGIYGAIMVGVGGLIFGLFTGLADRMRTRGSSRISFRVFYLGLLLAWGTLFLEGTPDVSLYMCLSFAGVATFLTLFESGTGKTPRSHEAVPAWPAPD